MKPTHNKMIDLDLRGFKGNPQTLLSLFKHIAKRESWSDEEIDAVIEEATKLEDYQHLIETIREYCKY